MKIIVFGIRGFPLIGGGAERHSEELYSRLAKMGDEILVLTRHNYFDEYNGIKFKFLPYKKGQYWETMTHSILCIFYCLFHKVDIVHIHNMGACLFIPLLKLQRIKIILTLHSLNYQHYKWGKFARFVLNLCEKIGVIFANEVIVISKELKEYLEQKYKGHIFNFIPNGVNEPDFTHDKTLLLKYRLEPKKYALSVGRFTPEKGFVDLIKAYNYINKPTFKLVIVGDEVHTTRYKGQLLQLANGINNIIFTGFLFGKELATIYTNAGLFVSTSFNEGFPLVLLEALSYSLPVLVSNIPAHRQIKLPLHRYFRCHNLEELSSKLSLLLGAGIDEKEKEQYQRLLKAHYDWNAISRATKEIYEYN